MRSRTSLSIPGALAALAFAAAPASAANLVVDDDALCAAARYATIQSAIDAAAPGDFVRVCPGTYREQLVITKDKLTLEAKEAQDPVIAAPATQAPDPFRRSIVRIQGAKNVQLRELEIAGPGPTGCDSINSGVRLVNGADATIADSTIRAIRDDENGTISGCQNGHAISVGGNDGDPNNRTTGTVAVRRSTIVDFQKTGVLVDFTGSRATITSSTITGVGCTPKIAANGIQVGRGAKATVQASRIEDNCYTGPQETSATGMLLFQAGINTIIGAGDAAASSAGFGNTLTGNDIGLYALDSDQLVAGANSIDGSASTNQFSTGIYNDPDSIGNRYFNNAATGHGIDCDDDSVGSRSFGTASLWQGNTGATSDPAGICGGGIIAAL